MKVWLLILGFFLPLSLFGRTMGADSIRIIGMQHRFETGFSRDDLVRNIEELKTKASEDYPTTDPELLWIYKENDRYVDTMLVEKREIENIISLIKKQKKVKKLKFGANECHLECRYFDTTGLIWTTKSNISYFLLMIVFSKGEPEFIWYNYFFLERGYYRYKLSDECRQYLSKYSHMFLE